MRQLAFSLTADAAQDGSVTRKKANNHGVSHAICALHANTSIGYRGLRAVLMLGTPSAVMYAVAVRVADISLLTLYTFNGDGGSSSHRQQM